MKRGRATAPSVRPSFLQFVRRAFFRPGHADNCDDCAGLEKPEDVPVSCQKCVLNKFACPKAAEKKPAAKDGAAEDALGDAAQSASSALQACRGS